MDQHEKLLEQVDRLERFGKANPPTAWALEIAEEMRNLLGDAVERPPLHGKDDLHAWWGLSYARWLVMPRVLMQAMPDAWQAKMADLLKQWDDAWDTDDVPDTYVQARDLITNKFTKWPAWVLNYRHPNAAEVEKRRRK